MQAAPVVRGSAPGRRPWPGDRSASAGWFLFDEPRTNLDAKPRAQMRVALKKLHERFDTTAIYITHDQVEATTLGGRVAGMTDGRVQQVGDPMEVYNAPANRFVVGFIGSPAMNFAPVRIVLDHGSLWAESDDLRIKVPASIAQRLGRHPRKEATLGVRPEDFRIADAGDASDLIFNVAIEVVERLGSEILLGVAADATQTVASVEPTFTAKVHERLRLAVNADRMNFFDTQTEAAT